MVPAEILGPDRRVVFRPVGLGYLVVRKVPELARDDEDLILAFARELDVLALRDLADLGARLNLALELHLQRSSA